LYAQIKQLAAKEYRSINAQMIALLLEALENRRAKTSRGSARLMVLREGVWDR